MLDETDYLVRQTLNLGKASFSRDETLQRAFVRSLEIANSVVTIREPDDPYCPSKNESGYPRWRVLKPPNRGLLLSLRRQRA